jgi:hypothetical protein
MNNGVARTRSFRCRKRDGGDTRQHRLDKRVGEMELRLVNGINGTAGARNVEAAQGKLPARGIAVGQGTTANTEARR